jgi:hypothetical protein
METYSVIIFKDFDMKKKWSEVPFIVEIENGKGRVHDNSGMSSRNKVSRWNKLSDLGGVYVGGKNVKTYYHLTVNGEKAFFTIIK